MRTKTNSQEVSIEIKNKVFSKKDVLSIADILYKEYKAILKTGKQAQVKFEIICDNLISYKNVNSSIKENVDILDNKKVKQINMRLNSYGVNKFIDVTISHGDADEYDNVIEIIGPKNSWTNAKITEIKDKIEDIKPQTSFFLNYYKLLFTVTAIPAGSLVIYLFYFVSKLLTFEQPAQPTPLLMQLIENYAIIRVLFFILIAFFFGAFIISPIFNKLKGLWPSVEFGFLPDHHKVEAKKRKVIYWVVTMILIPVILDVILFLLI